jgi:hypothetical protein
MKKTVLSVLTVLLVLSACDSPGERAPGEETTSSAEALHANPKYQCAGPSDAVTGETEYTWSCNAGSTIRYIAQSFVAKEAYACDAGIQLYAKQSYTPYFYIEIWKDNAGKPDKNGVLAKSDQLNETWVHTTPGRIFLWPRYPIALTPGQKYWAVLDIVVDGGHGALDCATRYTGTDAFAEGEMFFSTDGTTWTNPDPGVYRDLDFQVVYGRGEVTYDGFAMPSARSGHTATLMANGSVLIAGGNDTKGAELYVPEYSSSGDVRQTAGPMTAPRRYHSATLMLNSNVLLAGGADPAGAQIASTEIYDRITGMFAAGPAMSTARQSHTATLLRDGRVLIAGGRNAAGALDTAEVYNPSNGALSALSSKLPSARFSHTATLLRDGKVLVAGGNGGSDALPAAAIFDPSSDTFSAAASMGTGRRGHTATLLIDGRVLVAGGGSGAGYLTSAEIYDPEDNTWTPAAGEMPEGRMYHSATLLPSGKVVIVGGLNDAASLPYDGQLFDPYDARFYGTGSFRQHYQHTATMLPQGTVLIVDGKTSAGDLAFAYVLETYEPAATGYAPAVTEMPATAAPGQTITIKGTNFRGMTEAGASGTQNSPSNHPVLWYDSYPTLYLDVRGISETEFTVDLPCSLGDYLQYDNDHSFYFNFAVNGAAAWQDDPFITITGVPEGGACVCDRACKYHPPNEKCYDLIGSCVAGKCVYPKKPGGTACSDGDACTVGDVCDGAGTCAGAPYACTPNQCQTNPHCKDGAPRCEFDNKGDTEPCDDGNPCTTTDHCDGSGHCIGTFALCDAPPAPQASCTDGNTSKVYNKAGVCNAQTGQCEYTFNTIACTTGCNPDTGLCNSSPCAGATCNTPPNALCYNATGTCSNGQCTYTKKTAGTGCGSFGACMTAGTCDANANCVTLPQPRGTSCNDNVKCTKADLCDGDGACTGIAYTCPPPADCREPQPIDCDGTGKCSHYYAAGGTPCTPDTKDCTDDACGSGSSMGYCTHVVKAGFCLIEEKCYRDGDPRPGYMCQGCNPATDKTKWTASTACDDGDPCTTNDTCDANGFCAGTPYACPAPGQCQTAAIACDGAGGCIFGGKPAGTPCDDGDPCTENDQCDGSGGCAGTAYTCAPGPCDSSAACDGAGACQFVRKAAGTACDDGNTCTRSDVCDGSGVCAGTAFSCPAPTECQQSVSCDGKGGCTVVNKGSGEACTADAFACTRDNCDGSGACGHPVLGGSCLIDNECRASGDRHPTNPCLACAPTVDPRAWTPVPSGYSCDDGNPCTRADQCNAYGVCAGTAYSCAAGPCDANAACDGKGGCTREAKPAGAACDDGDVCTTGDACDGVGTCSGSPTVCDAPPEARCFDKDTSRVYDSAGQCNAATGACDYSFRDIDCAACGTNCVRATGLCAEDPCCGVTCDEPPNECHEETGACSGGVCTYQTLPAGRRCDDGDACTTADACDGSGGCAGKRHDCEPGECEAASTCDGKGGCVVTPAPDNTACSDGDPCTENDACSDGVCSGEPLVCDDPPEASCQDAAKSLVYDALGACDAGAGRCEYASRVVDCSVCADTCNAGTGLCSVDPCCGVTCDDPPNQECFGAPGTCDLGACEYSQKSPGDACSDGDDCTKGDVCNENGNCAGEAYKCPAPGECENVACDGTGGCVTTNADGQACTPDDDPCTLDVCEGGTCGHDSAPAGTACDDGDGCTTDDKCSEAGECAGRAVSGCEIDAGTKTDASTGDASRPGADGATAEDAGAAGAQASGGGCSCASVGL